MAALSSASSSSPAVIAGLGRALVQAGKITMQQAEVIARAASGAQVSFIDQLIDTRVMTPIELASNLSQMFALPLLDLDAYDPAQMQNDVIDKKLVQGLKIAGLHRRGNKLTVAVSDAANYQAIDQIKFQTQLSIEAVVVEHDKLMALLERLGQSAEAALDQYMSEDLHLDFEDVGVSPSEAAAAAASASDVDDAPVVRFLQKILMDAINDGASDIHFEPYERFYRIRFRQDGVLREITQPPLAIKDKLASRIKVISRLDISEKRVPQDGRMKLVLSKTRAIDFRVSTLPTLYGEKIVMRILDPSQAKLGIDALGYEPDQKETLMAAIKRPYGMVLVTGPTGSGKTVSLYTCLNILNQPGINISTAEDPAEIQLPGVNQVNMNDKAGLTFAVALKAFLRQDPDIIMVGEIRDLETADIAIKAAQTGHLVFSTLHTNDAPTTLTRLMNMGVPTFNVASSVILITAQRLVRKLCVCKAPLDIPDDAMLEAGFQEVDLDGTWRPFHAVGCRKCKGSGYKGRVGIYQVMPITEEIQRIILAGGNALEIADQARREGVSDLRQSGLRKVRSGQTSLEEVLAVTNE
ncbi:MAG: type IV-A pilus assembly ATPase PilB [Burkholderiaceae bacterium]